MLRPITALCMLLACSVLQSSSGQEKSAPAPPQKTPAQAQQKPPTPGQEKTFTAEQIAESTIFLSGSRAVLEQIRRNGLERGRITRIAPDGRTEEATYERRFVRGADATKDKIRMDQKMPTMEYSLIYGDGHLWGIINGANFTPRQDAAASFMSQQWHSIDALLRYKENGSTIALVGKEKQKGLDLYVLDLGASSRRQAGAGDSHLNGHLRTQTRRLHLPESGSANQRESVNSPESFRNQQARRACISCGR